MPIKLYERTKYITHHYKCDAAITSLPPPDLTNIRASEHAQRKVLDLQKDFEKKNVFIYFIFYTFCDDVPVVCFVITGYQHQQIQISESRIQDPDAWIQDAGVLIQDPHAWIQDADIWIQHTHF